MKDIEQEFYKHAVISEREDNMITITCPKGKWGTSSTDKEKAIEDAKGLFLIAYNNGEYN